MFCNEGIFCRVSTDMNALDALGLSYGDDDDDDDDDDEEEQVAGPPAAVVPPAAAALSAASQPAALPDAANLLMSLTDEVDWTARKDDDDEPKYDAKGTRYNSVALPDSMRQESDQFNARTGKSATSGGAWKQAGAAARASVAAALATDGVGLIGGGGGSSSAAAASSSAKGSGASTEGRAAKPKSGLLLPPQLRRPNVTTEDTGNMRTAKRHKTDSSK